MTRWELPLMLEKINRKLAKQVEKIFADAYGLEFKNSTCAIE